MIAFISYPAKLLAAYGVVILLGHAEYTLPNDLDLFIKSSGPEPQGVSSWQFICCYAHHSNCYDFAS